MFENVKAFVHEPKRADEMGDVEFRAVVREASLFFAAGWFERKNPGASDSAILEFAERNYKSFTANAIDFVVFVSEARARKRQAADN